MARSNKSKQTVTPQPVYLFRTQRSRLMFFFLLFFFHFQHALGMSFKAGLVGISSGTF